MSQLFTPSVRYSAGAPVACTAGALLHPDDVLSRADLAVAEKRQILASWASDVHAVRDAPGLRQLDSGAVAKVDVILEALRALDSAENTDPTHPVSSERGCKSLFRGLRFPTLRRDRDDDDDPPPCPAAALPFGLELVRRRKWESTPEPLAA